MILVNPTTLVLPTVESVDEDTSLIRTLSRVLARVVYKTIPK